MLLGRAPSRQADVGGSGRSRGLASTSAYASTLASAPESLRHEIAAKCREPQALRRKKRKRTRSGHVGRRRSEGKRGEGEPQPTSRKFCGPASSRVWAFRMSRPSKTHDSPGLPSTSTSRADKV